MMEWLMIFAGGLLGSSHCVGMCGGFALALGIGGRGMGSNLLRHLVYSLGRVFTYTVVGMAAGYGGWRLIQEYRTVANVQAILSFTAGGLLIVQGLTAAGVLRPPQRWRRNAGCTGAVLFAAILREMRLRHVFLGGVCNGLLPCGLVYAYLALAASSDGPWRGGLTMAVFGLGTLPVMTLIGMGGRVVGLLARQRMLRVAAWLVVLAGVLSATRGFSALPAMVASGTTGCPLCDAAWQSDQAGEGHAGMTEQALKP
jgi:sulfite exporter TauE/SafE